jgi:hypothetical protein
MTHQGSSQTRSPSGFSGPMRTSPIRHSEGLAQSNRRSRGQCGPVVQGSEDLLPHASCSSSVWYQVLGISAGSVPSRPLIFWGVLPQCGSDTALIVDHVAALLDRFKPRATFCSRSLCARFGRAQSWLTMACVALGDDQNRRVSQAAPVELGFRLASLRRVYLCRN